MRCYVTALGGDDFRALKSRLNWQIMDAMARNNCDFAFPSTSVYFETPIATKNPPSGDEAPQS